MLRTLHCTPNIWTDVLKMILRRKEVGIKYVPYPEQNYPIYQDDAVYLQDPVVVIDYLEDVFRLNSVYPLHPASKALTRHVLRQLDAMEHSERIKWLSIQFHLCQNDPITPNSPPTALDFYIAALIDSEQGAFTPWAYLRGYLEE